ncbi:DUF6252 family protein [Pseudomonas marginalis]|uniref:Uncharacterized protein n=1 Tax=Pseudomonas marginalis TaxID=298 RepID=A0A9X5QK08_PSEMA|nr:DUF6252 family protein [Pseudomonas marginalis]OAJ48580.1 hypothetical protein AO064_06945 [Pseudomonas marginalis]
MNIKKSITVKGSVNADVNLLTDGFRSTQVELANASASSKFISSQDKALNRFLFWVNNDIVPGTYNFEDTNEVQATYIHACDGYQLNYRPDSGSITILSVDFINSKIQATFNFTTQPGDPYPELTVKNGLIDISGRQN